MCCGFLIDSKILYLEPKHTFKEFEIVRNKHQEDFNNNNNNHNNDNNNNDNDNDNNDNDNDNDDNDNNDNSNNNNNNFFLKRGVFIVTKTRAKLYKML